MTGPAETEHTTETTTRQKQEVRAHALEAHGLTVQQGDRTIWRDASFTIHAGEFVCALGPNGAGKTTLLRLVLGLISPAQGEIHVLGVPPKRGNPLIGYVPQRRTLDAHLRVCARDFVMLGLDGHRWGVASPFVSSRQRQARREAVEAACEAVGATSYINRPVGQLSGGEQQRLLLAQSILGQPHLLLLDEPLASLDIRNQYAIAHLVGTVAQEHQMTVLLVTHDINPLLPMTQQVLYIAQKQITLGTPEEIISTERLSRLYRVPVEVMRDSRGRVLVSGLELGR
ncbi:metal ABC transporter ATP-binding protein [Ktedonobacter racemifer]|uniref:ABC transporter related protein n=1 Tax=Ktedonobacter racemifer DSM 44963 TaxID=485913 RepID=D6TXV9_KTERA|nr:ABC transporter ATP-binding protein [Ktedonobacter racemifer]EFH83156.1 ABC transporter related protein [Ktedonobacter racemifer DSM 44963]